MSQNSNTKRFFNISFIGVYEEMYTTDASYIWYERSSFLGSQAYIVTSKVSCVVIFELEKLKNIKETSAVYFKEIPRFNRKVKWYLEAISFLTSLCFDNQLQR